MSATSTTAVVAAGSETTQLHPTQYIEVMETMCNDLDVENRQLRQEIQVLREKHTVTREANVQLVNTINAKHRELVDATSSINFLQCEVERQAEGNRVLQRGAYAMSNEILDLRNSMAQATAQMQYQTQKLSEKNEDLHKSASLASDNADAFESSKEHVRVLLSALESAKADNLRLEQDCESASWLVKSLQNQLAFKTEENVAQMMMRTAAQEASQETEVTREAREAANRGERDIIESDAMGLLQSDLPDLSNGEQRIAEGPATKWASSATATNLEKEDEDHQNQQEMTSPSMLGPGRAVALGVFVAILCFVVGKSPLFPFSRWRMR